MKKFISIIVCITLLSVNINAQQTDSVAPLPNVEKVSGAEMTGPVYKIKPGIDIPAAILFDAYSIYGMSVIYGRDAVPVTEINALNKNNVNKFDRPGTAKYSLKAKDASDKFFYGSMPLPLLLMLDKKIRKDGLKMGVLFLETMGVTGVLYTTSAMIADRFRPYAYNPDVPMDIRTRGGARNSFYAGHPAVVATSTFFMATVYAHYHPDMKNKWILYSLAGAATAATGLLRLQAGQHFKTDVITGVTMGTLVGILIPRLHQNKNFKTAKLSLLPRFENGSSGFTALYKLGK